jgi:hypothetical protein
LREESAFRVFEKRALRRIFGPKKDDKVGGLRKLHVEELHNFYSLSNIIRIIKPRRMRRKGHVARVEKTLMPAGFWWESQKEREQ